MAPQPVGVVHVLVPGETTIDGLAKETDDAVPTVLAGPAVSNNVTGQRGQAEGFVQFTIGEQTSV